MSQEWRKAQCWKHRTFLNSFDEWHSSLAPQGTLWNLNRALSTRNCSICRFLRVWSHPKLTASRQSYPFQRYPPHTPRQRVIGGFRIYGMQKVTATTVTSCGEPGGDAFKFTTCAAAHGRGEPWRQLVHCPPAPSASTVHASGFNLPSLSTAPQAQRLTISCSSLSSAQAAGRPAS